MKICFICSHIWPHTYGGAERRYYELARELVRIGHEVKYITYDWGASDLYIESIGPAVQLYDRSGRRKITANVTFGIKAAKKAKKLACDIIDASVPYTEIFFLPPQRTVLTLLEWWGSKWMEYYDPLLGTVIKILEKKLIMRPKGVITLTHNVAEKVKKIRKDVSVVPCGLRLEEYLPYRTNEKIYDVTYIGRMYSYKGILSFLRVLRLVKKPLNVVIIGDGPLMPKVKEEAFRTIHKVNICRRISEEKKKEILGKTKVFVNMSSSEGFSISTLEAIILGAYPIIYNAHGYNAAVELVNTLKFGKIVERFNDFPISLENLTEIIIKPLDPEKLKEYDIKRVAQNYIRVIQQYVHD